MRSILLSGVFRSSGHGSPGVFRSVRCVQVCSCVPVLCLSRGRTELLSPLQVRITPWLINTCITYVFTSSFFFHSFQPISHLLTPVLGAGPPVGQPVGVLRASCTASAREKTRGKVCVLRGIVIRFTCQVCSTWLLPLCPAGDATAAVHPQSREEAPAAPPLLGEDAELVEQLRKVPPTRSSCPAVSWFVHDQLSLPVQNIEARLKVSLPSDLGAALTDGVVLCHLANHVKPRSVPSIHVPSPAVVSVSDWTDCWSLCWRQPADLCVSTPAA